MKFRVVATSDSYKSDPENDAFVYIETIEDLQKVWKATGEHGLIVDFGDEKNADGKLEIYDDYRE